MQSTLLSLETCLGHQPLPPAWPLCIARGLTGRLSSSPSQSVSRQLSLRQLSPSPGAPFRHSQRRLRLLSGVLWVRCSHQSNQLCVQDGECREGPWSRVHWGNGSEQDRQSSCSSQSASRPTTRAAACAERSSPQGCGCSPTKTSLYSLNRLNVSGGEELGRPGEK